MPPGSRKHIAILSEFPTIYGGESSMLAFCQALRGNAISFSVICPSGHQMASALSDLQIAHHPFNFRDVSGTRYPLAALKNRLSALLKGINATILHANSLSVTRLAGPVGESLKIPTIGHLRDIMRISKQAMHDINSCKLVLCVSNATLAYHQNAGLHKNRSAVQYNGVDLRKFQPRDKGTTLRAELGIRREAVLIGAASQIILRKGLDVIARAFAAVAGSRPEVHLLIAGTRNSQKEETVRHEKHIRGIIKSNGIDERVHFLGYIDDMPRFYQSLDVFVHAPRQEPLGRVLLEAAACGVPVITTRVGGTEEIFTKPEQAILVSPEDHQSLAKHLLMLLNNENNRLKFGRNARLLIEDRFDIRFRANELLSHYHRTAAMR